MSTIDLVAGYHQIPMDEESQAATAFSLAGIGHFEYKFMPWNAPAVFQQVMEKILTPFLGKFVLVYLDDIIIFPEDFHRHLEHVAKVLEVLVNANLIINWAKSHFLKEYTEFLRVIVGQGKLQVSKEKTKCV